MLFTGAVLWSLSRTILAQTRLHCKKTLKYMKNEECWCWYIKAISWAYYLWVKKLHFHFFQISSLVKSQAQKVKAMAQQADFSTSLGFMYKIKTEIYYITSIVRYASHFLNCDIRICCIIDDVDQLGKQKLMGLFQVSIICCGHLYFVVSL